MRQYGIKAQSVCAGLARKDNWSMGFDPEHQRRDE